MIVATRKYISGGNGHAHIVVPLYIVIEDWWQKIAGEDWQTSAFHNPAAYNYCLKHQSEYSNHSVSVNWVLYGKIGGFGYLVNVNELKWPEDYKPEEDYIFVEKETCE